MNCKQGDLVVCVRADAYPELTGRIFKVTTRCSVWPDAWNTEPVQFVRGQAQSVSFADFTLRPINNPGDDEVDEISLRRVIPEGLPA